MDRAVRREGRGAGGEERKKERKGEEEDLFRKRKSTAAGGGVGQRETEGERNNNSSDNNNIEYYGVRGVSGIIIIQGAPGGETMGQAGGCMRIRPKRLRMAQVVSRTIRPSYRPIVFLGLSHGHMGAAQWAPYHTVHTLHTLHTSAHRLNWPSGVLPARS